MEVKREQMWKSQQTKFLEVVIDKLVFESEESQVPLLFTTVCQNMDNIPSILMPSVCFYPWLWD